MRHEHTTGLLGAVRLVPRRRGGFGSESMRAPCPGYVGGLCRACATVD